jgi:cytoskeletal protein RodZ
MAGFGEALRRERELREISLRDIADATKINMRYLEALEHNRFEILPGGVFNKGFIRAYARFIGADGEALVDRYMLEIAERDAASLGAQPTPGRPGLMRPTEAPPRRAGAAAAPGSRSGGALAAGRSPAAAPAVSAVVPAITLMENSRPAAAAWPAPTPQPSGAEAEATRSRLLLALATVVAAAVAIAVVVMLLRAARGDATLPAHDSPVETPAAPAPQDGGTALTPETAATPGSVMNEAAAGGAGAPAHPSPQTLVPDQASPGAASIPPAPAPLSPAPAPATATAPHKPDRKDSTPLRSKTDDGMEGAHLASPVAPPQPQHPIEMPPAAPPSAPSGPMTVRIQALSPVGVQVSCDGDDKVNRSLVAGDSEVLRCFSVVRVSATDAGALALSIDGAPCAPLGPAGGRVEHFTIRPDTARAICPLGASGGGHGRP